MLKRLSILAATCIAAMFMPGAMSLSLAPPALAPKEAWVAIFGTYAGQEVTLVGCVTLKFDIVTIFSDKASITGTAACNAYTGGVTPGPSNFNNNDVSIVELRSTKKYCDDALNKVENAFFDSLKDANQYTFSTDLTTMTVSGPNSQWIFQADVACPLSGDGNLVQDEEDNGVCSLLKACCVEDCCGSGTSWDNSIGRCALDPNSSGFQGAHSPDYNSTCRPIDGWACCEGDCCGEDTVYDTSIDYCVPPNLPQGLDGTCDSPPCCCDPLIVFDCLVGDPVCCPDGNYACPMGDTDVYLCNGVETTGPFSSPCPEKPPGCTEEAKKCPDGSVVVRNPDNDCKFDPCCCDPNDEPGQFGNPICTDNYACCPDGSWSCSIGDGRTFPCEEETVVGPEGPFGKVCPKKACTKDARVCPDGSTRSRDPENDCEFFPCCCEAPREPGMFGNPACDGDHACCADGTWACANKDGIVSCDGTDTEGPFGEGACEWSCCDPFEEPGRGDNPICKEGHACCPDGTWSCSIGDGKTFMCGGQQTTGPFPDACGQVCTADVKECADGSYVSRNPKNNCEFDPCCCDPDSFQYCFIGVAACCPDGNWSCPNGETKIYMCEGEESTGPFGKPCEKKECSTNLRKQCPDGSTVGQDPDNDCEFFPCCCDSKLEPGQFGNQGCPEGHACCPDGEWGCSTGALGEFSCGKEVTKGPFGKSCNMEE